MRACFVLTILLALTCLGCSSAPEPTGDEDLAGLTLDVYWAEWCGPCRQMKPNWIRLAENYPDLEMTRIDIDKDRRAASQAEIESIPQAVVIYNGREIGRVTGLYDYNTVVQKLARMKAANR